MKKLPFLISLLIIILFASYFLSKQYFVICTSYCEVYKNPTKYDGWLIKIKVRGVRDGRGHYIYDPTCTSEKGSSNIVWSYEAMDNPNISALLSNLSQEDGQVDVVIIGRFRAKPAIESSGAKGFSIYLLDATNIKNIKNIG